MARRLGRQTVTVFTRERRQHGKYVDVEPQVWTNCVLLPKPAEGDTRLWTLLAPAGRRAVASAQCIVVPGPTDSAGAPLRLDFATATAPIWDRRGRERLVSAEVRLVPMSTHSVSEWPR